MPIPEEALKRGLELAKGALIFGVPFTELTHEELIAVAALGWKAEARAVENHLESLLMAKRFSDIECSLHS